MRYDLRGQQGAVMMRILVFVFALLATQVHAVERVALVIGNAAYTEIPSLENPARDATLAAETFRRLGFQTIIVTNQRAGRMRKLLADFREASEGAETAVIYFAGHGMQIGGDNYLLPVDTRVASADAAIERAVPMSAMIDAFAPSAKSKILLLDACRNNPFAGTRSTLSGPDGLARANHEVSDLLVLYAAQPNRVAFDGQGANSPFMEAVAATLTAAENVRLSDALIDITNRVRTSTSDLQVPYIEGTLSVHVEFSLKIGAPAPQTPLDCKGRPFEVALGREKDFIELPDPTGALTVVDGVGTSLRICPDGTGIQVSGPHPAQISCDQIREPTREGTGYYYADASGRASHLWFHVDAKAANAPVEIGLYRDDAQLHWIDTQWRICG